MALRHHVNEVWRDTTGWMEYIRKIKYICLQMLELQDEFESLLMVCNVVYGALVIKKGLRSVRNNVECEAHRELLIQALSNKK